MTRNPAGIDRQCLKFPSTSVTTGGLPHSPRPLFSHSFAERFLLFWFTSYPSAIFTIPFSHTSWGSWSVISKNPFIFPFVVVVVQSSIHVQLFVIPWTAACQASLSLAVSQSLPKFMFIPSVMLSSHLILWCLFSFCPQSFLASGIFTSHLSTSYNQNTGASASSLVLSGSIRGWSSFRLTGSISLLSRDFQESSPAPQFEDISSLAFCLLYGPALTTVCDLWENHNLDYMDFCCQSNVSALQYPVQVCHCFPSKKQSSSDFMAAVTIYSDFGAQEEEIFPLGHCYFLKVCQEIIQFSCISIVTQTPEVRV